MKRTTLLITSATIAIALLFACSNNKGTEVERTTLLSENFAAKHPDWQLFNDTIVKDLMLKLSFKPKTEIPFRFMFATATDMAGVPRVAFYQLDRMGGTDMAEVTSAELFDLTPESGSGWQLLDYYSFTVSLKPAYPVKDTIWQGFSIDITGKGKFSAVGVEEVNKP
jgi:hypothetical protein